MLTENRRYILSEEESQAFYRSILSPSPDLSRRKQAFLEDVGSSIKISETETGLEIEVENLDVSEILASMRERIAMQVYGAFQGTPLQQYGLNYSNKRQTEDNSSQEYILFAA